MAYARETPPDNPLLLSSAAVKALIRTAKKRGYVTYDQINSLAKEDNSEQIEDVLAMFSEMGINVVADAFFGLYGPANMAADRVQKIGDAVAKTLATPDIQAKIRALALTPSYADSPSLQATQATHLKRWEAPIKASGFTVEQ